MNIPITKISFDECEEKAVLEPLKTGWLVQGANVRLFEEMFAKHTKIPFAKATTSCTTALHLGLVALGVTSGDKVVVPSFTYVASANAVRYTGAEVVFCDVELATLNIDVQKLEQILKTQKIKAVMPVNLFGVCANMPQIMQLAQKYGVKVIEDSACGFDSWIDNAHSGSFGDIGCFSFHPRKSISTGEGGMLVTKDENIDKLVSCLRDHGAEKSDLARHESGGSLLPDFNYLGYNYRLTDIQGALGVCQMTKAKDIMDKRRKAAQKYLDFFAKNNLLSILTPQRLEKNYTHGYQSFVCIFELEKALKDLSLKNINALNQKRNDFMQKLEQKGIATRQGTHAVHTLGYYKNRYNLKDDDFLHSYAADRLSIALPLYNLSPTEFEYVARGIIDSL